MELNERLDKFEKLVSDKPSNFLSKLAYYKANKKWIDQSSKVAINVLEALSQKGLSQKDLAQKMNVSAQQVNKIIKGKRNYSQVQIQQQMKFFIFTKNKKLLKKLHFLQEPLIYKTRSPSLLFIKKFMTT